MILEILAEGFENTKRKVVLIKLLKSYDIFKELVRYYCANQLLNLIKENEITGFEDLVNLLPVKNVVNEWMNIGGQLIPRNEVVLLTKKGSRQKNKVMGWNA
jgi:hypothetical protein